MRKGTISEYVTKAIQHAVYEYCDETKSWCGYIRELPGCWAQGNTIEETKLQLIDVIEGWLILVLQFDDAIPQIDGLTLWKTTKKGIEMEAIIVWTFIKTALSKEVTQSRGDYLC